MTRSIAAIPTERPTLHAFEVRAKITKPDIEWMEKLTLLEQAECWAASGWLMASYGYRWRAGAAPAAEHRRAA